ncbi:MAG: cytochrome b N-terminal domain-containing protein [Opitutaceae bacterium]|nr:cytochrome b N-terminal domain-containing protein [Opitutaceae bacterium]
MRPVVPTGSGGAADVTAPAVPPVPPVRGDAFLNRIDRAFAWVDGWLSRWLPPDLNPLAHAGAAANLALIVAVASGVLLLIWYSPSVQFAYSSLTAIQGVTLGGWVRALHRYSSDLAMLLLVVHAGRVFFARKFGGARWLPWVSGVAMLGLVWFIGWTGYWLVWDQPAQQVAVSSMRLLDGLPIFGEPLARLYVSDRTVPSLLFFVVFFLHMLLPLAIAVGLAVHLARVSRARLLPSRALSWSLIAGLAVASLAVPAPLDAPARMAVKAASFTVDAWYLSPLALGLRLQEGGLWIALAGGTLLAGVVPWLLGRRRKPETFQASVNTSRCHACTQCVQDCPFDAITMVARTDGKNFPSQAQVDPARCVGCGVCAGSCDSEGIALTWFDTRVQEAALEREIVDRAAAGSARWVALVAADISGAPGRIERDAWQRLLPDCDVQSVPTASWVRPRLVERMLARGAKGVLVVRDASAEAWARDGGRWVEERLAGARNPIFRPERAAGGAWAVLDFDRSRPENLTRAARALTAGETAAAVPPRIKRTATVVAGTLLLATVIAAAVAPSHFTVGNPVSPDPELVISFKAVGQMVAPSPLDPATEAKKPVHMRGRTTDKPHRAPVIVRVSIDGVVHERSFTAKGVSRDGPAIGEWREPLTAGAHDVKVEMVTGPEAPPARWQGTIRAEARKLNVISYEPRGGFVVE